MPPKPQPWYTRLNQPPRSPKYGRNRKPSPPTHRSAPDRADPAVDPGAHDAIAFFTSLPGGIAYSRTPQGIPYSGIIAGEIIGHRMWMVLADGTLCSLAHKFIWEPQVVIEGKVDEVVDGGHFGFKPIFGGVYSYTTKAQIIGEAAMITCDRSFPTVVSFMRSYLNRPIIVLGVAIGTIKCWGEVIEHEFGWRAQYAKLHSIDDVIGGVDINTLRERYKV